MLRRKQWLPPWTWVHCTRQRAPPFKGRTLSIGNLLHGRKILSAFHACGLLFPTRRKASIFSYGVICTQLHLASGHGLTSLL